jgi:hypothetical protein
MILKFLIFLLYQVIGAATQCALATSQLVACAKVVAPTISDPLCQEQLVEAAREVAKSVEGCVTTCRDVSRDEPSLRELGQSATDVTRALNDLLNHVKDGQVRQFYLQFSFFFLIQKNVIFSCLIRTIML